MRFSRLAASLLATLIASAPVSAQYFSEGWKPGQPLQTAAPNEQAGWNPAGAPPQQSAQNNHKSTKSLSEIASLFSLEGILGSQPAVSLFGRFGINITERLSNASKALNIWDERIPLITDENYADMIVNEPLSEEEEKERVWFLVITVSTAQPHGISEFVDKQFDAAFNLTVAEGDLPNVRWGRIDYMNVTAITTKWVVWNAPVLVIATNRGQTLRFYKATQIRLRVEFIRDFLKEAGWQLTPPWNSAFAPGGKREFVMNWFAFCLTHVYRVTSRMPRWLLYIVTGAIGSVVIQILHRNDGSKQKKDATRQKPSATKPAPTIPDAGTSSAVDSSSTITPGPKPTPRSKNKKASKK